MELISIKDYCKAEKITDAGARKRVSQKLVKSIILDGLTYIVDESNSKEKKIKELRVKLRNSNDRVKLLRAKAEQAINQELYIKELKEEVKELRAKIETLHEKKEAIYEKVIEHQQMLMLPNR